MIRIYFAVVLVVLTGLTLEGQEVRNVMEWERYSNRESEVSSNDFLFNYNERVELDRLAKTGWLVLRRLDKSHVIIRKPMSQSLKDIQQPERLLPANYQWKLSPNSDVIQASSASKDFVFKSLSPQSTVNFLNQNGISASRTYGNYWLARQLNPAMVKLLLKREEVIYLGQESQKALEDSRVLDMNLNPNRINLVHHHFPDLMGQGTVLSVKESGYNAQDIDLVGRNLISDLTADFSSNHATEMATIAAGAGNSSLNGKGVASRSTLTSSFLSVLFPDADQAYQNLSVSVQNHSYGTEEIENFYGAAAEAYDLSANANPALLHVFSLGNQGASTPDNGAYAGVSGMASITGNFKASKNTLTVGSVDTVGRKVAFVSNGPAHDGRVKPELVAYSVFGSSNSAALVSGVALLLQQAYEQAQGSLPTSALLKALLINGARDVGTIGPDYLTGFGNVDAYRSLQSLQAGQFTTGNLADGEQNEVLINVPANAVNLKVTLVWNDPAAAANANLALVNDLDLVLEDADATTWQPWVLNIAADRLTAVATPGTDRLNNVEQVSITNPVAGALKIKVTGADVPEGPQAYSLVWTWEMAESFDWTFPSASDNMPYNGETTGYFRWESTLAAATGVLEYSTDGGVNWELIDAAVALDEEQYRWEAPQLKTAALARMTVEGQPYLTGAFTISRPERISVGFSCADSVRIQWNELQEAISYEVLSLGDAFMEQVAITTDTAYTFNKSDFQSRFFSVQPVLADGARPIASATFDYDFQGVGCYLISFFTELVPEEGVYLNLDLGTPAGIVEVAFERQTKNGDFELLTVFRAAELNANLRPLDPEPFQGLNSYRVRMTFENGEELFSEVSSAYFLTTQPFLVFPNPLPRGEVLSVFSRTFEDGQTVTLTLFDQVGNKAFDLSLNSDRFAFDLSLLPAGLYTYRIVTEGVSHTGRLILN